MCVDRSGRTADDALSLITAIIALVTNANKRRRTHVRIANGAATVAFVAQLACVDAGEFTAKNQICVVSRCHLLGGGALPGLQFDASVLLKRIFLFFGYFRTLNAIK